MRVFDCTRRFQRRRMLTFLYGVFSAALLVGAFSISLAETDVAYGRLITSHAIAINLRTHKVYAVDEGANRVIVTDEHTGSIHSINVGGGPIALAVNPRTDRVYVVNESGSSISVIDGLRDKVTATIAIRRGSNPYVIAVDVATNRIYVTNTYSDALIVIDGETNAVAQIKTGSADGIAIDPRSNTVFLMTYEDPNIRIVNAATGVISKVNVGPHLWGITFDQANDTLYLGHTGTANVVALNEMTHAVRVIPTGNIPCAVAVNPRTQMIYAVNYRSRTVSVINAKTDKTVATLPVGQHPQAVAVDPLHNRVYVANVRGNGITAIDGATNKVIGNYDAGKNPYDLAIDPVLDRVYAANFGEPAVTAVNVSQATVAN